MVYKLVMAEHDEEEEPQGAAEILRAKELTNGKLDEHPEEGEDPEEQEESIQDNDKVRQFFFYSKQNLNKLFFTMF